LTKRETYPCASLEDVLTVTSLVSRNEVLRRSDALEMGISSDALRLAEILGFIEAKESVEKNFQVTSFGKQLITLPEDQQKIIIFRALLKEKNILPPYFKRLIETRDLHNKRLTSTEICDKLDMRDRWSADILNEWCRYLGLSDGATKSEVFLSSNKLTQMKKKAFVLTLLEEYKRLAGPSRLVPVAKLRRELKNSGILGKDDDFDKLLEMLLNNEANKGKIKFYPAPAKFVGLGLCGRTGYELLSLNGIISFKDT